MRRQWHPLQYSCLENPMEGGAWWAAVHGVAKSRTQLSDFTFSFHFHALKKEIATHSSVLAWRISGTAEPGGLPSMGSHRVGHNWSDLTAAAGPICLFMLLILLPWETNLRRYWYNLCQRMFCLCFLLVIWCHVLYLSLKAILSLFFHVWCEGVF